LDQSKSADHTDPLTPGTQGPAPDTNGVPAADDAAPPPPPPPAGGNSINIFLYLAMLAGLVWLFRNYGIDGVIQLLMVVFGLGFLIFIHELGHFLAAKWCDVHVQTFSIGFGPALPGCSFTRGETMYKIAAIPLGGYVNMVGEGPEADEDENYPRSFKNKSVGQRMLIISAGVIMNVLCAAVAFVIVYRAHGLDQAPAVVFRVDPGSPAWKAGVRAGWKVIDIDGKPDPWFVDLQRAVSLSRSGREIPFTFEALPGMPTAPEEPVLLSPFRDGNNLVPAIGVSPVISTQLEPKKFQKQHAICAYYFSAAASARVLNLERTDVPVAIVDGESAKTTALPEGAKAWQKLCEHMRQTSEEFTLRVRGANGKTKDVKVPAGGFDFDDSIVGTTDPSTPDEPFNLKALPLDPTQPAARKISDPFAYRQAMRKLAGKPAVLQVRRAAGSEGESASVLNILVPPAYHLTMGLRMQMGMVAAVREGSVAEKYVEAGDVIVGAALSQDGKTFQPLEAGGLDPVRLPYLLRSRVQAGPKGTKWQVQLTVLRTVEHKRNQPVVLKPIPWDDSWSLSSEEPLSQASPMSIAELGIAYWVENRVAAVAAGSPAARAGIAVGDVITDIRFRKPGKTASEADSPWGDWISKLESERGGAKVHDQWAYFFRVLQRMDFPEVEVKVQRAGAKVPTPFQMTMEPDTTWPLDDRGLFLRQDTRRQKAKSLVDAVGYGMSETWVFIETIYLNLTRLVSGRISPKVMGGPLTIATTAFTVAQDPYIFLLYLGIISINLAVVNFLPIPVLDGGHMVFLIYEWVAGRPPSEMIRIVTTYLGLAFILLLMLFVLALDFKRIFPWLPLPF
jgi:regulator of sigma E protease